MANHYDFSKNHTLGLHQFKTYKIRIVAECSGVVQWHKLWDGINYLDLFNRSTNTELSFRARAIFKSS